MKLLFTAVIVLVAAAAANVSAEPVSVFKRSVLHREHDDDDDDDAHKIDQGELTIIANTDGAALQALAAAQGGSCGFNAEAFGPFRSTDDILPQGIVQDISFVGDVTAEINPADLTQENSGLTAVCATAANTARTVFGVFSPPFNSGELNTQRAFFADTSFYSVSLKCPVTNVFFVLTSVAAPSLSDITVDVSRGDGPVTQATATVVNVNDMGPLMTMDDPAVLTSRTVTYLSVSAVSGSFDNIAIRGSSDNGFCISQVKVGCDEFEACFCEKGGDDDDDDNDDDDDDDNLPNIQDDDDDDDDGDDDDDDDDGDDDDDSRK